MADSKFLKWQDKNGDMLPDVCPDIVKPAVNPCLECSPNPTAIVPNWKKGKKKKPFLNEQTCMYQVGWLTPERTTGAIAENTQKENDKLLEDIFEEHSNDAIKEALIHFNKDSKTNSIEKVKEVIEYTSYYLDPRPGSHLKLLYSFPFDVLFNLPDAEEDEEEEEPKISDRTVTYSAHDLLIFNIRVRKGLWLYARYLNVYQTMEGGNLLYVKDNRVFNLHSYGDVSFGAAGRVGRAMGDLDEWLNARGFNLPNTGTFGTAFMAEEVKELEFTFDAEEQTDPAGGATSSPFKLKKLVITSDKCGKTTFGKGQLASLNSSESWRDPTTVAYFAQMREMHADMSARVEIPWLEVLKTYTYPAIYATINAGHADLVENQGETSLGVFTCIGDALAKEGKQLGQDILSEFFSIGDAVAYEWHKKNCQNDLEEVRTAADKLGHTVGQPPPQVSPNLMALARTQAFKEVDSSDQVYTQFCARLLMATGKTHRGKGTSLWTGLNEFYRKGADRIAMCGLLDLLVEGVECLFGGVSLEEALSRMIKSALTAMSLNDFGRLFAGLPPDKQAELDAKVQEALNKKSLFPPNSITKTYTSQSPDVGITGLGGGTEQEKEANRPPFWGQYGGGEVGAAVHPWENPDRVKQNDASARQDGYGNYKPKSIYDTAEAAPSTRRTLAQSLDFRATVGEDTKSDDGIIAAYILALLDLYQDNYLELLDELNRFPGAQIIAWIFASVDCPQPPLFNPGIDDFIKSLSLPFCRNTNAIVLPYMDNPALYWPKIKNLLSNLWEVMEAAFMAFIYQSLVLILEKVCQVVGDAICHALETVGTIAASLPGIVSGRSTFAEVIKESICGGDDELVDDTIAQLMNDLGPGGAAFADRARALTFAEDISSAGTKAEVYGAMLGEPTEDYCAIVDEIIEYEYPEYREALPGCDAIENFFHNVGNLTPLEFRSEMREVYRGLSPEQAEEPINPTLCATPEQLDNFKELRCQLLEGRATPEQCDNMFDNWRGTLLDGIEGLSDAIQQGSPPDPFREKPLFSDPGCTNGLLPREPEIFAAVAAKAMGGALEKLELAHSTDMIGNGPRQNNYGFVNMVLSDTLGNPYTAHQRLTNFKDQFVNFYTNPNPWAEADAVPEPMSTQSSVSALYLQEGAYPEFVAEYLMYQFQNAGGTTVPDIPYTDVAQDLAGSLNFESSNEYTRDQVSVRKLDFLGAGGTFGDLDLVQLPDMGYNVQMSIIYNDSHGHTPAQAAALGESLLAEEYTPRVKFTKKARKAPPDITLKFRDNSKGYRSGPAAIGDTWGYGFNLNAYIADIYKDAEGNFVNRQDDNTRIYIADLINENSKVNDDKKSLLPDVSVEAAEDEPQPFKSAASALESSILKYRKYSFLAVDNGLDMFFNLEDLELDAAAQAQARRDYNLEDYPNFAESFVSHVPEIPQVNLLFDFFNGEVNKTVIKNTYDSFMSAQFAKIAGEIGDNERAWLYGASFDNLSFAEFQYVVPKGVDLYPGSSAGQPISEVQVYDYDSDGNRLDSPRDIRNDDGILGVSKMQFLADQAIEAGQEPTKPNRVFYLDPMTYGGNYMNPPVYVTPMTGSNWMGIVDLLFPEMSPCKPSNTNLIDFEDLKEKTARAYTSLPDDPRLLEDPDCTEEVPYNRILERTAKAGIQGLILASIRTFVGVHYLKSLATFTKFAPKFPDNYSNVYAMYIVARMEEAFKDSSTQWFSPIQNNDFWYAFLEQAVQMYGYMVDAEAEGGNPWKIDKDDLRAQKVPLDVIAALEHINNYQESYVYPHKEDLDLAQFMGLAGEFDSLKTYRQDLNLEAVRATEDSAKTILKELVTQELNYMSDKFVTNLGPLNMVPTVIDLDYYYMSTFCAGSTLELQKEFVETPVALPSSGSNHYTIGNEFSLPDGSTYVGYYHVYYNDEESRLMYMIGEEHSDTAEHDELRAFANKIQVPIGDVPSWESAPTTTTDQPFVIEKYISLDGSRMDPDEATSIIKSKRSGNISDHYPGTLERVRAQSLPVVDESKDGSTLVATHRTDPQTGALSAADGPLGRAEDGEPAVVGLKGELGVRYGLSFSMDINGTGAPREITSVEIDALDLPVSAMATLEGNSKLLLCLLNKLKEDPRFKMITQYIFSMKRAVAIMAIYNDMGFLPSIGEYTVASGDLHAFVGWGYRAKPGGWIELDTEDDDDGGKIVTDASISYVRGWAAADDRNQWGASPFFMKYDEWDQQQLRNSVSATRDLFRTYYYARDTDPSSPADDSTVIHWIDQLKERFRINPARGFLPWWKQNRVRSNPFNSNGQICTKKD